MLYGGYTHLDGLPMGRSCSAQSATKIYHHYGHEHGHCWSTDVNAKRCLYLQPECFFLQFAILTGFMLPKI